MMLNIVNIFNNTMILYNYFKNKIKKQVDKVKKKNFKNWYAV